MTAAEFGVPAIAVSGPGVKPGDRDPGQFAAAADFTARLVRTLARDRGKGPLVPSGMIVNVNYPKTAKGVRAVPLSSTPLADVTTPAVRTVR